MKGEEFEFTRRSGFSFRFCLSLFTVHFLLELNMPTVKVRNLKNEEVGEVELSDAVFGAPLNEGLIHAEAA